MLLNQILSRENMLLALKRVEQNKGSHGVDMMPVQNLRLHIVENWLSIKEAILKGTYEPMPVRRVEIPKPDGRRQVIRNSNCDRPFDSTSNCPDPIEDI